MRRKKKFTSALSLALSLLMSLSCIQPVMAMQAVPDTGYVSEGAATQAEEKQTTNVLSYENTADQLSVKLTKESDFDPGTTADINLLKDNAYKDLVEKLKKSLEEKNEGYTVNLDTPLAAEVNVLDEGGNKKDAGKVSAKIFTDASALKDSVLYHQKEDQTWEKIQFDTAKDSSYVAFDAEELGNFVFAKADLAKKESAALSSDSGISPLADTAAYADAGASNTVNDVYWWYDNSKTTLHLSNKAETDAYQLAVTYRQPWSEHNTKITQVVLDTEIQPASTAYWFDRCSALTNLYLGNMNTVDVRSMYRMFHDCSGLKELNLGDKFDTSNVQTMDSMFGYCSNLKNLDLGDKFDTSHVTDMSYMFSACCSLTSLDLGNKFNTGSVLDMEMMFYDCRSLTSLDLGDKFDTGNVTNMNGMFKECRNLKELNFRDLFDTGSVKNMHYMFEECNSLTSLDLGDKFDTGNVTNMNTMFSYCSSLTSLNLGDKFDTGNMKDMQAMFAGCSGLTSLDLGDKFDTSSVTTMYSMFSGCSGLTSLDLGDKFYTGNVIYMYSMFSGCSGLTSLDLGDKFDTSHVTNMNAMFSGCSRLTSLDLGDKFDTSSVTTMKSMFNGCSSLTILDLGDKFDTSNVANVTDVADMFKGCDALQKLVSQKSGRQDIELPRKMIEQDSPDGVVYSVMPSGSKILVPFAFSAAESITDTTIVMRKSMDKSFENVPVFEFGVYREDGTLVDTVKNDRDGNIVIETRDYALGRYYVQEKAGTDANIIYDTSKYYFTVSEVQEKVTGVHVTHGDKVTYYTSIDPSLLTGSDLQLSEFSEVTVTDSEGKTHTLRSYCANLSGHIPYGTAKQVYINPTDAEINKARGTVYAGPQENLSDAIRCILYFENEDAQGRIWDLFNRGKVIDTSRVDEIPADFQFAIITPPSFDMQPLIVPLADIRVKDKKVMEEITTGIVKKRVVTLETPVSVFKNRTRSSRLTTLTVSKKVAGSFGDRHRDFKFCLALDDDSITSLSYTKGDVTETVTRNADNQFEFTLSDGESAVFADLPVGTGYTVTEPDARAEGYEVTADGATGTIQENGSTVLFTNHRSMVVPTGVDTNMAVFGMILAAGCILLIGYCLKHRKK